VTVDLDLSAVDFAAAIRAGGPARQRLYAARPVAPLPAQREILERAVAHARLAGLEIPRFSVRWVDTPGLRAAGRGCAMTELGLDGSITLFLSGYLSGGDLRATVYHECQHLADLGGPRARVFTEEQLEARAERFAAEMLGWR
jgi:hypothetical protein